MLAGRKFTLGDAKRGLASALRRVAAHRHEPRQLLRLLGRELHRWRTGTGTPLPVRLRELADREHRRKEYTAWVEQYDTPSAEDLEAMRARTSAHNARFSVVMPVFNPEIRWLEAAIDSMLAQVYPHWELCIADDCSTDRKVRQTLQRYAALDERVRVTFRETNGHISAASNSALELATGDFLVLLDHDDALPPHALAVVAAELSDSTDADLLYSDEDKIDERGNRFEPYFKPDWNPDLFRSHNLVSHLGVYRTSLVRELGGFREGYEGSQDWDLALRVVEKTDRIAHIPHVLYHWRATEGSAALGPESKSYAYDAALRALADHLARCHENGRVSRVPAGFRVQYQLEDPPRVSILIPTRDRAELLERCLDSVLGFTDYPDFRVVVIDNGSTEPATRALFDRLGERIDVIRDDAPFNFAALNNLGARESDGDLLAFVNNDIQVITRDWLAEMASHAMRPNVGAVGALLYHADQTVQHAGIILGMGGIAAHAHRGLDRGLPGYMGRAALVQSFSAVTGACMVVRRDRFEEVGGFDEELGVAYNDVDLCLRLKAAGYRTVWTPYAELYHHESATRGFDTAARLERETAIMRERWGERLENDPAFNPNLSLNAPDLRLAFPPRISNSALGPRG